MGTGVSDALDPPARVRRRLSAVCFEAAAQSRIRVGARRQLPPRIAEALERHVSSMRCAPTD
jgi:hypothetical protein